MNRNVISIEAASSTDVDDVAEALASAFSDDPVFSWCLPDAQQRSTVLPGFFALVTRALLRHEEVFVAGGRAAALWVPPGTPPIHDDLAAAFEADLAAVLGDSGSRAFELMALLDAHHPHDPHRFLWFLGTTAAQQGRGLGSSLLQHMLDRCDLGGTPAYLEATSADNRRLYERHGFCVVDELTVPGGPTLWTMWRDSAQVRHDVGTSGR